jgi:Protein kinase domain
MNPAGGGPSKRLPRPGERLADLELLRELGRGGMGAVYAARDALGREVAVKVLLPGGESDLPRLRLEAEALARLDHPSLVRVHTFGVDERGRWYVVMELVPGESLQTRLERHGPLPVEEASRIARDLTLALQHTHERGVLHRDLKPHNVLLEPGGRVALTDFGLARLTDRTRHTETGEVLGTPAYMAPEQAAGQVDGIGPPADVYGLGATLFALLTGEPPFRGATFLNVCYAVLEQPAPAPSSLRPGLPPGLDALVLRCLAKAPADRPGLAELRGELERLATGGATPRARGHAVPALALGVAALALLMVWIVSSADPGLDAPAADSGQGPPASALAPAPPPSAASSWPAITLPAGAGRLLTTFTREDLLFLARQDDVRLWSQPRDGLRGRTIQEQEQAHEHEQRLQGMASDGSGAFALVGTRTDTGSLGLTLQTSVRTWIYLHPGLPGISIPLTFAAAGRLVAVSTDAERVLLVDVSEDRFTATTLVPGTRVALAAPRHANWVAAAVGAKVKWWGGLESYLDLEKREVLPGAEAFFLSRVTALAASDDGRLLAAGTERGGVYLLDPGQHLQQVPHVPRDTSLSPGGAPVRSLAFWGDLLVVTAADRSWAWDHVRHQLEPSWPRDWERVLATSPRGALAYVDEAGTVRVLDPPAQSR